MVGTEELTQLGQRIALPAHPEDAEIECIPWDSREGSRGELCVRFTCPEFTSLCPVTGAPDFARIVIDYVPDKLLIESKSLKLFLNSFRNEGAFHERVVDAIGTRLAEAANPYWMRICGFFYARGGIPLDVFWVTGEVPGGIYIPDPDLNAYHGR